PGEKTTATDPVPGPLLPFANGYGHGDPGARLFPPAGRPSGAGCDHPLVAECRNPPGPLALALLLDLVEQVLGQHGNRAAIGAFFLAAHPGGARDIQVGPLVFLGKTGQEAGGGDGACRTATDI